MKLLDLLIFNLQLIFEIGLDHFRPEVLLIVLILMELELLLDQRLHELIPETLDQIKLVLEHNQTEEDLPVLELAFAELELSDLADFLHHGFDLVLQLLVEGDQLEGSVDGVGAVGFGGGLGGGVGVDHVVDLGDFVRGGRLGAVALVVHDDLLAVL